MESNEHTSGSQHLLRDDDSAVQTAEPHAPSRSPKIEADHVLPREPGLSQMQPGITDHLGLPAHSGGYEDLDDEDVDNEALDDDAWTQISGPSDEDMSVSDDASVHTAMQCRTPKAILDAESSTIHQPSGLPAFSEIHQRYTGFATLLCKETATEDAGPYIQEGLPAAIDTARSIRLDKFSTHDEGLDVYAFALVIHVWQIVCYRMEQGTLPAADIEESLCLNLSTYFLSAHAIISNHCTVSSEELRCAVQYWEDRLKLMGHGNRWMEDPWTKAVPQNNQEEVVFRNEIADRYLEFLERYGKEGLGTAIIEQETKGDLTQLRTMSEQTPHGMRSLRREIAFMLYSMDTSLLKAMIQGQLPRLAEVRSGCVYKARLELNQQDFIQPGTYMNCICDPLGLSPTPHQWYRVCEQMIKYVQVGSEHNELAQQIDQQLHPKSEWSRDLAHKGLRRYTEWRSYMETGTYTPDTVHRNWVKYFVDQLRQRMEGQPIHAPLTIPVVEIGFSNDPRKRLRQHRHHESSNYLMNLAEATFQMEYPGAFRLQQMIVFACFRPIQPWLSEIVVTQLAQGYVQGAGGFSHEPAGRSNTSSNRKLPAKVWTMFEGQVYADGQFFKAVRANRLRLEARDRARVQAEEELAKEKEASRKEHAARVAYLKSLIELEEAKKNVYDALSRRLAGNR